MTTRAKKLEKNYVTLSPKGHAEIWKAGDFWKLAFDKDHPKNKNNMGYLVSSYEFTENWESWEKHPNGDEIVYCISGAMTFILRDKAKPTKVKLTASQFTIIPKDIWHTAIVHEPSQALFVTWGFGTQHRARDSDQT